MGAEFIFAGKGELFNVTIYHQGGADSLISVGSGRSGVGDTAVISPNAGLILAGGGEESSVDEVVSDISTGFDDAFSYHYRDGRSGDTGDFMIDGFGSPTYYG